MKQTIYIVNLIDWSKSFVDENGSFYCGTTTEQKQNTAKIVELGDLVISASDLHPETAPEHKVNGGLFPVHNAVRPERLGSDFVYMVGDDGTELTLGDKTVSPCLTEIIEEKLTGRPAGIIAPRDVYFQGSDQPFCTVEDLEATFGQKVLSAKEFIQGDTSYVIAPKKFFDATRTDSNFVLPQGGFDGIPEENFNVYDLIQAKFPADKYNLVLVNTGVVEGICRLHTSIGQRQMFPAARIINISDATTPLAGIGLGYETAEESRDACMRVCKDIGIEHMDTQEFLAEYRN